MQHSCVSIDSAKRNYVAFAYKDMRSVAAEKYLTEVKYTLTALERIKPRPDNHQDSRVLTLINKLEELARAEHLSIGERAEFSLLPEFRDIAQRTRTYFQAWEIAAEQFHASDELGKDRTLQCDQLERTLDFAVQEGVALGIGNKDHVVFVGSGYFPESAIALAQHLGCRVTCVEQDALAVSMSEAIIKKWKMNKKINVVHSVAEYYDYRGYTAVLVAVMAHPKQHIVDRILKTNPHAKIACRSALYTKSLLYEPTTLEYLDRYRTVRELFATNSKTIIHSILIDP